MKGKRSRRRPSLYKHVIGKTVRVPGQEFGVDVPDLFYEARIIKKDTSHPGAVIVRFIEDGSIFWLPVNNVYAWLQENDSRGLSDTVDVDAEMLAAAAALLSLKSNIEPLPQPAPAILSSPRASGTFGGRTNRPDTPGNYGPRKGRGPCTTPEPRVFKEANLLRSSPVFKEANSLRSSQVSDFSVADMGRSSSSDEEWGQCSEAPSSVKRSRCLCEDCQASEAEVSQPRKRLRPSF